MQEGAQGYTFRLWESIVLNKKLLTNNLSLADSHFYDDKFVKIYDGNDSDQLSLSQWILDEYKSKNRFIKEISPENFLRFIDNQLLTNM